MLDTFSTVKEISVLEQRCQAVLAVTADGYTGRVNQLWRAWPQSALGRLSLTLGGVALLLWMSTPLLVQLRERVNIAPEAGLSLVIVVGVVTITAVIMSWVSLALQHDRSVVLLISACVVTAIFVLALVGETLEFVMMLDDA